MDRSNNGAIVTVVGVLALVVSVVALVLAWVAFNNTSDANLEAQIQRQLQDSVYMEQSAPPQDNMNTESFNEMPGDTMMNPDADDAMNGDTDMQNEDAIVPENN